MKVGDMVICKSEPLLPPDHGLIVAFNEKGYGGKEFVHVLIDGEVRVFLHFNVVVVQK